MAVYLLDTSTLTLLQRGNTRVNSALAAHAGDTVGVTSVTVDESLGGWYSLLRKSKIPSDEARAHALLADAVGLLAQFPIFPLTEAALNRFDQLVRLKLNVGRMDLRIAALALEMAATLVTNNAADFRRVPGLIWVDWSV
jgi:tRNA(fMet)-specific endonuclease VapC